MGTHTNLHICPILTETLIRICAAALRLTYNHGDGIEARAQPKVLYLWTTQLSLWLDAKLGAINDCMPIPQCKKRWKLGTYPSDLRTVVTYIDTLSGKPEQIGATVELADNRDHYVSFQCPSEHAFIICKLTLFLP